MSNPASKRSGISPIQAALLFLEWLFLNVPVFTLFLIALSLLWRSPVVAGGYVLAFWAQVVATDIMWRTARGKALPRWDWRWVVAWLATVTAGVCLIVALQVGHQLGDNGPDMLLKTLPAGLVLIVPLIHCEWLGYRLRNAK